MKEFEIVTKIKLWPFEELHPNDRQLVEMAIKATEGAYAEYSHFYVGAAARLADGTIVTGANQENAAFPSSLCAERTTLFAAQANYPTQPVETIAIATTQRQRLSQSPNLTLWRLPTGYDRRRRPLRHAHACAALWYRRRVRHCVCQRPLAVLFR